MFLLDYVMYFEYLDQKLFTATSSNQALASPTKDQSSIAYSTTQINLMSSETLLIPSDLTSTTEALTISGLVTASLTQHQVLPAA